MIGLIQESQMSQATQSIALAVENDPFIKLMEPNDQKRLDFAMWMVSKTMGYAARWGKVFCSEDASGAAIWLTPGNTDMGLRQVIQAGFLPIPFKIGIRGMGRMMRIMSAIEPLHKKSVPGEHWYLQLIGVDPKRQGAGLGTALVEAGTSRADEDGLPCYLETAIEGNVEYFSRFGFEVAAEAQISKEFKAWVMVRQPR